MAKSFLVKPDDVQQHLIKRYKSNLKKWLEGKVDWPVELPLGIPAEREVLENLQSVQEWQQQWYQWQGHGEIKWVDKRWSKLGIQKLPERILFHDPLTIARWLGREGEWLRTTARYNIMLKKWPGISRILSRYITILIDYENEDFNRLVSTLEWLENNPNSAVYIRQLPIEGIDTKWVTKRKSTISDLLKAIRGCDSSEDFYQVTGVRREPGLLRFRVLDSEMRGMIGGLSDISAAINDIANMCFPIRKVYIVENLQTGLAFNDLHGAIVFMSQGYAIDAYSKIPWINNVPIYYWGDIDTHGFAILNRLRSYFPNADSMLMDEVTFVENKKSWVKEDKQLVGASLKLLTDSENRLYQDISENRWGDKLRLEQERIPWNYAWSKIKSTNKH